MMAAAMSWRTGLPIEVCEEKIKNFFLQFEGVSAWMEKQKSDARSRAAIRPNTGRTQHNRFTRKDERVDYQFDQYGYITTVFGRKRVLRDANHWNRGFANGADRQAANTPIQGSASDVALQAVLRLNKRYRAEKRISKLFGFIHDSIETDTHPSEFIEIYRTMKEEMEDRPKELYPWLCVPIKVSAEVGHGWGYMVEIDNFDLTTNTLTLKGGCAYHKEVCDCHEANVLSVIRALSTSYEVSVIEDVKVEKNGSVVGHKAVVQLSRTQAVGRVA
jgi:DNA polymerase I-like protein with 3'-5' exonuclease and polymerase domains